MREDDLADGPRKLDRDDSIRREERDAARVDPCQCVDREPRRSRDAGSHLWGVRERIHDLNDPRRFPKERERASVR